MEAGGRGDVCPHKYCLVRALPPQKSAAVTDGYVTKHNNLLCAQRDNAGLSLSWNSRQCLMNLLIKQATVYTLSF